MSKNPKVKVLQITIQKMSTYADSNTHSHSRTFIASKGLYVLMVFEA